jgi:hypothetical protein
MTPVPGSASLGFCPPGIGGAGKEGNSYTFNKVPVPEGIPANTLLGFNLGARCMVDDEGGFVYCPDNDTPGSDLRTQFVAVPLHGSWQAPGDIIAPGDGMLLRSVKVGDGSMTGGVPCCDCMQGHRTSCNHAMLCRMMHLEALPPPSLLLLRAGGVPAAFECQCALPAMLAPAIQCCCCLAWPTQLQLPRAWSAHAAGRSVLLPGSAAQCELLTMAVTSWLLLPQHAWSLMPWRVGCCRLALPMLYAALHWCCYEAAMKRKSCRQAVQQSLVRAGVSVYAAPSVSMTMLQPTEM